MNVEEIFENYKNVTKAIILNLKNDLNVENLMSKRENIIKEIIEGNFDKNLSKETYINKGLVGLDKELKDIIEKEQIKVKDEIQKLHNSKKANNIYGKNKTMNSYFNKII